MQLLEIAFSCDYKMANGNRESGKVMNEKHSDAVSFELVFKIVK